MNTNAIESKMFFEAQVLDLREAINIARNAADNVGNQSTKSALRSIESRLCGIGEAISQFSFPDCNHDFTRRI
jgi:hypothetical protein